MWALIGVSYPQEVQYLTDQVYNMAAIMYKAALTEDISSQQTMERVAQLEYENKHLRELLQFSTSMMESNERHQPNSQSLNPDGQASSRTMAGSHADGGHGQVFGPNPVDSLTLNSGQRPPPPGHPQSPSTGPEDTLVRYDSDDSRSSTPHAESSPSPADTPR